MSAVAAILEGMSVDDQKPIFGICCAEAAHGMRRPENRYEPALHQSSRDWAKPRSAVLADCGIIPFNPNVTLHSGRMEVWHPCSRFVRYVSSQVICSAALQ